MMRLALFLIFCHERDFLYFQYHIFRETTNVGLEFTLLQKIVRIVALTRVPGQCGDHHRSIFFSFLFFFV